MTQEIIAALKTATGRIRADYRESLKRYNRLDRKSRTGNGLDFEGSEQHDFEDGFRSALHMAIRYLTTELSAVGVHV
jgi:hypothetical protein